MENYLDQFSFKIRCYVSERKILIKFLHKNKFDKFRLNGRENEKSEIPFLIYPKYPISESYNSIEKIFC